MAQNTQTQELLDAIISAHGGHDRWKQVNKIQVTHNFHGLLLELKGYGGGTRTPSYTINTKGEPSVIVTNLGDGDRTDRWIFKPDHVSIESANGKILQERSKPREAFAGHELPTPWDDLNLLYFIGYAMYNYLTAPFLFLGQGFKVVEVKPHSQFDQMWRVLKVAHPEGFPTHTRVQYFYFGAHDFLLKRLDYEADVLNGTAAHYVFDYKNVGGLLFPTVRRVVRKERGTRVNNFEAHTSFWLQFTELKIIDEDGSVHEEAKRIITT